MKPIWQRKASEIEEEDYEQFYNAIAKVRNKVYWD